MSDDRERKPTLTASGRQAASDRQRRLAAALRDNLRKRKAQQRARSAEAAVPSAAGDGRDRES